MLRARLLRRMRAAKKRASRWCASSAMAAKPMSVEDAILEMNLLGHSFYMFNNVESGMAATVYRRRDGGCGLIEIESL